MRICHRDESCIIAAILPTFLFSFGGGREQGRLGSGVKSCRCNQREKTKALTNASQHQNLVTLIPFMLVSFLRSLAAMIISHTSLNNKNTSLVYCLIKYGVMIQKRTWIHLDVSKQITITISKLRNTRKDQSHERVEAKLLIRSFIKKDFLKT